MNIYAQLLEVEPTAMPRFLITSLVAITEQTDEPFSRVGLENLCEFCMLYCTFTHAYMCSNICMYFSFNCAFVCLCARVSYSIFYSSYIYLFFLPMRLCV